MVEALPLQFRAKRIPPVFPLSPRHMQISSPLRSCMRQRGSRTNREESAGAKIVFLFTIPGESLCYTSNDVEYSRNVEFHRGGKPAARIFRQYKRDA